MKIRDNIYHPCSLDILEFQVTSIQTFENEDSTLTVYTAKATAGVGACGRVEVLLTIDVHGLIRFYDLQKDYEYSKGLQDFVEGVYYTTKPEARLEYYNIQKTLAWSNMENKRRLYEEAKVSYDRCTQIIKEVTEEIKELK